MNHPISDEEVAGLDLRAGRAELLEQIMSIPVDRDPAQPAQPAEPATLGEATALDAQSTRPDPADGWRRRRRYVPALAAAAAVLVAAGVTTGVMSRDGDDGRVADVPAAAPAKADGVGLAALRADGWTVTYVVNDEDGGELQYSRKGDSDADFDIRWQTADLYQSYYDDRTDIGPATAVTVLGRPGTQWAYGADDHTVIREPEAGYYLEFRGTGMDEAAYRALLEQLVAIGPAEVEEQLPPEFVTTGERPEAIRTMAADIPLPPGFDLASIDTTAPDPYQLGVAVTGAITCAWIDGFAAAEEAGDTAAATRAQEAMATSRDWKVLRTMQESGDFPDSIWNYADELARGEVPQGYQDALGCG